MPSKKKTFGSAFGSGIGVMASWRRGDGEGSTRRLVVVAGLAAGLLLTLAVAAVAAGQGEMGRAMLTSTNQFESEPAFDAPWTQKDLQHHVVRQFEEPQVPLLP